MEGPIIKVNSTINPHPSIISNKRPHSQLMVPSKSFSLLASYIPLYIFASLFFFLFIFFPLVQITRHWYTYIQSFVYHKKSFETVKGNSTTKELFCVPILSRKCFIEFILVEKEKRVLWKMFSTKSVFIFLFKIFFLRWHWSEPNHFTYHWFKLRE